MQATSIWLRLFQERTPVKALVGQVLAQFECVASVITDRLCALKKIPKEFTVDAEFQREMNALLHIRAHGGHPNICMLRENFDEQDDYLLVLDLVDGGEMFSALIKHGAYSEADASRLLRQVASALDFCHGIGVVHAGKFVMDLSVSISKVIVFMIHDG